MAPPAISARLTRDLVLAILPPLKDDPQVLRQVTEHIAREVKADVQGSSRMTWGEVEASIAGLARTARVRVQSDLADALDKASGVLDVHREKGEAAWEGDMPVKMSNLPQHVQFLLAMSCQPNPQTHDIAHEYLHRPPPEVIDQDRLLFDEIMTDPFEGEHWGKGYDSEVKEGWTDSESSGDDREEQERIITPLRERIGVAHPASHTLVDHEQEASDAMSRAEDRMRRLREGYWQTGGVLVEGGEVGEGWRAISTGLSVASLAIAIDGDAKLGMKAISGKQFQRELLFALSGRPGLMLDFYPDGTCFIVSDHPTVVHYSPVTVTSILKTIQSRATQASLIWQYIQSTLSPITSSSHHAPAKTSQAFAEACRVYISRVDSWVADIELAFVRGVSSSSAGSDMASTPLSLQRQLDEQLGTMLDCISAALPYAGDSNDLLNALYSMLDSIPKYRSQLLEAFITTASPMWSMLGDWLNRGMPVPRSLIDIDTLSDEERKLDAEFWVYRDQDVSWADEDFWEAAFLLKEERPAWIDAEVLTLVLEAGKARGLLRGLLGREIDLDDPKGWVSLEELFGQGVQDEHFSLVDAITTELRPLCQLTTFHLRRTLDEDCGLQAHLEAIDGLFYLRGFSTLQPWTEWLFTQITTRKRWADFQVLTSTIREIIEKQNEHWLNPHAIRIRTTSRPRTQDPNEHISPDTLSVIKASYQVPFPLSHLFTSTSLDLRADVFVFLLQVQFGKALLDQTRSYESPIPIHGMSDLLRLRHKLNFVINTLWVWITERVIELETEKYKANLDKMTSFGEMIQSELKHVRQIREFAFQHTRTSVINDTVKSILELTSTIHDLFFALNQSPFNPSPPPPSSKYIQGRSRRRQRLAQSHRRRQAESSDSEGDEDEAKANRTLGGEISFAQLSLKERVERIQRDLTNMVVTLKDGVEELARGEEGDEGAAEIWGMLSFALEDWR